MRICPAGRRDRALHLAEPDYDRRPQEARGHRRHRASVEIYFDPELDNTGPVLDFGCPRMVVAATCARWRTDSVGRHRKRPLPGDGRG